MAIKDLLRYKDSLDLKDRDDNVLQTVWVRLMTDENLNLAAKLSRIKSMEMRFKLRDTESIEYKDQIVPIIDLDRPSLEALVVGSVQNQITSEAYVKVNREELPKIEEF